MRSVLLKVMLRALIDQFSIKDLNDKLAEIFDDKAEEALVKGNNRLWEELDAMSSAYDKINLDIDLKSFNKR